MTVTLQSAEQTGALPGLGFVRGGIRTLLRLEGLSVLAAACAASHLQRNLKGICET